MARPLLEVADIFRGHGSAWRHANRGHVSLDQLKVMSAIESCRTAALGGHVARCENDACGHTTIAYNSCLMGKFRNGEPAHKSIGLSVDSESFRSPLREALGQGAQLTLSLSEVKGFFCAHAVQQGLNGFGPTPMQVSMVSGAGSTKRHSEYPVSPKARSRNVAISGGTVCNGEQMAHWLARK
jgi:hypothetical protein